MEDLPPPILFTCRFQQYQVGFQEFSSAGFVWYSGNMAPLRPQNKKSTGRPAFSNFIAHLRTDDTTYGTTRQMKLYELQCNLLVSLHQVQREMYPRTPTGTRTRSSCLLWSSLTKVHQQLCDRRLVQRSTNRARLHDGRKQWWSYNIYSRWATECRIMTNCTIILLQYIL
jgi:hypothetical protein